MSALNVKLYDVLRKQLNLSDDKASPVPEAIEEAVKDKVQADVNQYNSAFRGDFKEIDTKIDKETFKLELKVEQSKTDMIKWFFAFFLTIVIMILGLYFKK